MRIESEKMYCCCGGDYRHRGLPKKGERVIASVTFLQNVQSLELCLGSLYMYMLIMHFI